MRKSQIERNTKETQIVLSLNLDGDGKYDVDTGVGFFDHMMTLFACHSGFDLTVKCKGDVRVDGHHSVEDIGIVLGKAIAQALGDKVGIKRYASVTIPMDESLASVTVDISGRQFLVFNAEGMTGKVGDFDIELVEEFFRAVANQAGLTLHINLHYGSNNHHKIEAIFKAFARALKEATTVVSNKIPSSKGMLE
ncbi:MAG: imidazoleglycerol-phosphate dehydratase HisB [Clostridia bacterium]|nr:imidazoleglycerol-phosphate dehydratase HisB [Clostridia bacterium]